MTELETIMQATLNLSIQKLGSAVLQHWDAKIKADFAAGKLDALIADAHAQHAAGCSSGL